LIISLVGVAFIVAATAALGFWRTAKVDEFAARERAAFDEPDFKPATWFVSLDARAAACVDEVRASALIAFAVGDRVATRRFLIGSKPVNARGDFVVVKLQEPSRRAVTLRARDALEARNWAGALSPQELDSPHELS
jgi:hypothetical protein